MLISFSREASDKWEVTLHQNSSGADFHDTFLTNWCTVLIVATVELPGREIIECPLNRIEYKTSQEVISACKDHCKSYHEQGKLDN